VQIMNAAAFTALLPELTIPSLPFIGAYAIMVVSLDGAKEALRARGAPFRRYGPLLIAPFPPELGLGSWIFVETASALPWRA